MAKKNEYLVSVISEIADKENDAIGKARVGALGFLADAMGVSRQCVSLWLKNGMPSKYRGKMQELMLEKGVYRKPGDFEAIFKVKE